MGYGLLLARIVLWVDVINASRTDELNLENALFISCPSVVSVLSWIHPERARLYQLAYFLKLFAVVGPDVSRL